MEDYVECLMRLLEEHLLTVWQICAELFGYPTVFIDSLDDVDVSPATEGAADTVMDAG